MNVMTYFVETLLLLDTRACATRTSIDGVQVRVKSSSDSSHDGSDIQVVDHKEESNQKQPIRSHACS